MPSAIAAARLRLACRKSARGASLAAMSICRALASKDEADPLFITLVIFNALCPASLARSV